MKISLKNLGILFFIILGLGIYSSQAQGKNKVSEKIQTYSHITKYGEVIYEETLVTASNKQKLDAKVKDAKIKSHAKEFKDTSVYREKALKFDDFYTDPVTGWPSKNAIVVDKIQTVSFDPAERKRNEDRIDAENEEIRRYNETVGPNDKRVLLSKREYNAVAKRERVSLSTKDEVLKSVENKEKASAEWITNNNYSVDNSNSNSKDKLYTTEGYEQKLKDKVNANANKDTSTNSNTNKDRDANTNKDSTNNKDDDDENRNKKRR